VYTFVNKIQLAKDRGK